MRIDCFHCHLARKVAIYDLLCVRELSCTAARIQCVFKYDSGLRTTLLEVHGNTKRGTDIDHFE